MSQHFAALELFFVTVMILWTFILTQKRIEDIGNVYIHNDI